MNWDMRGKRVLVTGATNGIGLEASRTLARLGARVILIGRDAKTARRLEEIRASAPGAEISSLLCDFSQQSEVRGLADQVLRSLDRLDVLVNNAGAVFKKRTMTEDGIEATFAVNHLGSFLLTQLLLERIVQSAPARIVNVASVSHRRATMDFDDLFFERGYSLMKAYGRSKLANVLYTRLLAQKLAGTNVTVNCMHPGTVDTGIWSGAPLWTRPVLAVVRRFAFIRAEQGARHTVHLVASPELSNTTGQYFEEGELVRPSRLARDDELAQRLWDECERLTGLRGTGVEPVAGRG
jgi:NAD(P)-dependent dehydrogenase (short-subunit alcohol dehydrogenase family)